MDQKPVFICIIILSLFIGTAQSFGETTHSSDKSCMSEDRACVLELLHNEAKRIDQTLWRDQVYRELSKTYAFEGMFDKALNIIPSIQTPDTQAMTIRGIGMTIAAQNHDRDKLNQYFDALTNASKQISAPASYAIALTYIAMAQAFAHDDQGAWDTAASMENDALRHKAYAETAEIQAEFGKFDHAMKSIAFIESQSFRNKAYTIISKIFAEQQLNQEALNAAMEITNAYKKAQAIQTLLDLQKSRDVERHAKKPQSKGDHK